MRFEFHHFHHPDRGTAERLGRIENMLGIIHDRQEITMATLEDLKASVQKNTDAEASVVTLLAGISQQLKDAQAANDPAAIQAVIDQIDANTTAAAAAVVANTPAA
jgi:hypothetical protein